MQVVLVFGDCSLPPNPCCRRLPAASRWLKRFAFLSTRLERFYDKSDFALVDCCLPASFLNAGNLTLVSELAEADTADAEFAEVTVRSTANLAAVVFSGGILLLSLLFNFHRSLCHLRVPPLIILQKRGYLSLR